MDLESMIEAYLKQHGYDGLYWDNSTSEEYCACYLGDLFPCCDPNWQECRAGYRVEFGDGGHTIVAKGGK